MGRGVATYHAGEQAREHALRVNRVLIEQRGGLLILCVYDKVEKSACLKLIERASATVMDEDIARPPMGG